MRAWVKCLKILLRFEMNEQWANIEHCEFDPIIPRHTKTNCSWPLQWYSNSILPIIAKLECISSQRKSDIYIHSRERGIKNWITIWYDFWKQIISICLTLIWSCFVCEINFTFKWIKIIIILMNELWTIYFS